MDFEASALTDVGLKREINQDSILVDLEHRLFIVADGMGGHKGGEVASALAIETAREMISQYSHDVRVSPRQIIQEVYREASSRIHHKSQMETKDLAGMGTTMVMMWEMNHKIYVANVGDSRAYLYRKPHLWQITEDHSLLNEQIRAGVLTEEEAQRVISRNVITRSVGYEQEVTVDVFERSPMVGETFMLCSDGLSGLVDGAKMVEILKSNQPLSNQVRNLIEEAKKNGGDDNISVVLARVKSI